MGDQPKHYYILKSGKVDLLISHEDANVQLATISAGGTFGFAVLMALQPHEVTILAVEDSGITVLSR
jgi:CRP-like cAMP-binding protein